MTLSVSKKKKELYSLFELEIFFEQCLLNSVLTVCKSIQSIEYVCGGSIQFRNDQGIIYRNKFLISFGKIGKARKRVSIEKLPKLLKINFGAICCKGLVRSQKIIDDLTTEINSNYFLVKTYGNFFFLITYCSLLCRCTKQKRGKHGGKRRKHGEKRRKHGEKRRKHGGKHGGKHEEKITRKRKTKKSTRETRKTKKK